MAGNEITAFQGIKEKITEKVKTTFFELLPQNEFDKLVEAEVKAFFEATTEEFSIKEVDKTSYYSGRNDRVKLITPVSPFRAIVWAECKTIIDAKIGSYFDDAGFSAMLHWDNGIQMVDLSPKLEEVLKKQASDLAAKFFSTMFAQAFQIVAPQIAQEVKDRIQRGY